MLHGTINNIRGNRYPEKSQQRCFKVIGFKLQFTYYGVSWANDKNASKMQVQL